MDNQPGPSRWRSTAVDRAAAASSAAFIIVLAVSAYWDQSIRLLHLFEALPYGLAAVLSLQQRKFGYLVGAASGAFWLWMAGTQTTFIRNGFERVAMLVQTGHVDRWEQFIAAPAAMATGSLIVFSVLGYARLRGKSLRDVVLFLVAQASVAVFFALIFWLFAPQYLALFKRAFR